MPRRRRILKPSNQEEISFLKKELNYELERLKLLPELIKNMNLENIRKEREHLNILREKNNKLQRLKKEVRKAKQLKKAEAQAKTKTLL